MQVVIGVDGGTPTAATQTQSASNPFQPQRPQMGRGGVGR